MNKAAIYHRVSTTDQDAGLARDELRAAVAARSYEIALDVEETGSGARNDRPGLQQVLDAARRGRINAVFVWKLDRFGRSALDLLSNIRTLEDSGCRFVAVTQGIDVRSGGDSMSRLLLTMLAAVAEFERELIVERTRLGLAKARAKGKRFGRPLAENAPAPATVAAMRAEGGAENSWGRIARRLHCTPSAAQRAFERAKRLPENGVAIVAPVLDGNASGK